MKKKIGLLLTICMVVSLLGGIDFSHNAVATEAAVDVSNIKASEILDFNGLVGWATLPGEGIEGVVGGGDVKPVVASDYDTLQAYASDNIPRVIFIDGTIKTVGKIVSVGSNKTIIGIDENATLDGGFEIKGACNIIISNLNIKGGWPSSKPDDGILVHSSHHVWLDHLNIWDAPDGNLDLGNGSDYVTISWCKFWYTNEIHDHRYSNLVGSGTGHDDTDMGKLNVTYHHNWFADLVDQRQPRILYGKGHVYNNYYTSKDNYYCIGVGCYASALIENNYFKEVNNPYWFMYPNDLPAYITERNNICENTTGVTESGYVDGGWYPEGYIKPFDNPPYTYYPDAPEDVPEIVESYVGPHNILDEDFSIPDRAPQVTPYPEPEVTKEPIELSTPAPKASDNPITYDAETGIYNYNGVNSDDTNGRIEIPNPFKGMDLSETLEDSNSAYPEWKNGVTISYWVKIPEEVTHVPVINFNLENDREMAMSDKFLYNRCKEAESGTGPYVLGTADTYYTMSGKEITVLKGTGRYSKYSSKYPSDGAYRVVVDGDIAAYKEGADLSDSSSYALLTYIGEGYHKYYGARFDEEGGEKSLLAEAYIDGSLSLFSSGSVLFGRDDGNAVQINPNLDSYGVEWFTDIDIENYFVYWGNGARITNGTAPLVPTIEGKDQWHFVVTVIQNDWIQTYMDGIKLDENYINLGYGMSLRSDMAGIGFNKGYGARSYYHESITPERSFGMTILDMITDEDTVLTIGDTGAATSIFGMDEVKTSEGVQIKDVRFYAVPLEGENVGEVRTQTFTTGWKLEGDKLVEIEADSAPLPTPKPTATPEPTIAPTQTPQVTATPEPSYQMGDVSRDKAINPTDALFILKDVAGIITLSDEQVYLGDFNDNDRLDPIDALQILKYVAKLIDEL